MIYDGCSCLNFQKKSILGENIAFAVFRIQHELKFFLFFCDSSSSTLVCLRASIDTEYFYKRTIAIFKLLEFLKMFLFSVLVFSFFSFLTSDGQNATVNRGSRVANCPSSLLMSRCTILFDDTWATNFYYTRKFPTMERIVEAGIYLGNGGSITALFERNFHDIIRLAPPLPG